MDLKNKNRNKNLKCARYSWNFRDKSFNLMSEEEAGIAFYGHRNCDTKGHKLDKKIFQI